MQFEIGGARPQVDSRAVVAPTAVLSGDVKLGANAVVSFGAVILGDDPAVAYPPSAHDQIWAVQQKLDFPGTVYGVERLSSGMIDIRLARTCGDGGTTGTADSGRRALAAAMRSSNRHLLGGTTPSCDAV